MIDRRYESGKSFVMYSKEELEAARRTDMVTFLESTRVSALNRQAVGI